MKVDMLLFYVEAFIYKNINCRNVLNEIAKKLRCKFKLIPDPRKHKGQHDRNESEEENLDVVHPPPRLEDLVPRPPVCAIVGHIDHGKTTLLDHLRKSSIVSLEVRPLLLAPK